MTEPAEQRQSSETPTQSIVGGYVNVRINQRQFVETLQHYANVTQVLFDGSNYHVAFWATSPIADALDASEGDPGGSQAQTVARIVLPELSALTLYELLRQSLAERIDLDSLIVNQPPDDSHGQ